MTIAIDTLRSRVWSILISEALGDALGSPHELKTYNGEYTGELYLNTIITRQFNEPITLPIGAITDDTQMTHALINALVLIKNNDVVGLFDQIVFNYINFANTKPHSLGHNTRALFRNIKTIKGYEGRLAKVDPNNQSDGTLMRASALAYLPQTLSNVELFQIIDREVTLTNKHPNNVLASYIYVRLLRYLLFTEVQPTREAIYEFIIGLLSEISNTITTTITDELRHSIEQGIRGEKRDVTGKSKGWVLHGVYATFYALFHCHNVPNAIATIVGMGGDTDTNAKIASAVMGCYHGLDLGDATTFRNIQLMVNVPTNDELHNINPLIDSILGLMLC